MVKKIAQDYVNDLIRTLNRLPYENLERIVDILVTVRDNRKKVIIFGNGGSASTASHMACDFGKETARNGRERLRAIDLHQNVSLLTAAGNDLGYEEIFVEQLRLLLDPGDVLIALSTSGNSANLVRAIEFGKENGAFTIGLVGGDGGWIKDNVDEYLHVENAAITQTEDIHVIINHIITRVLRDEV
ncbi:SIS domain-containing protein [Acidobacteriota bacterium]